MLTMVDTSSFPQETINFISNNHDLLEDIGIFPEYMPLLGISSSSTLSSLSQLINLINNSELEMEI